jgi:hypothetical protein
MSHNMVLSVIRVTDTREIKMSEQIFSLGQLKMNKSGLRYIYTYKSLIKIPFKSIDQSRKKMDVTQVSRKIQTNKGRGK